MSEEKYTIDIAEEESIVGDWLIANENMLDSDNPQDVKDFNDMRDYYRDLSGYYATPEGFIKTAIPAAMGELGTVKDEIGKFISNPVQATKNAIEGTLDLTTVAATNLLPKKLTDLIYSGMDDPTSDAYKINQMLPDFLQTKPRAQYEAMGEQIGTQLSNTMDLLSSPDTAAKLIAQNPLESTLYASGVGNVVKAPIKATGILDNKVGNVVDVITDQSPTSLLSGVPQILKSRANKAGDLKAAQRLEADAKIKAGITAGYVLPPSASEGSGILTKIGRAIENAPFIKTRGKSILQNQQTTDKLTRKYLNVPEDTALEDIFDIVKERSGPAYEAINSLKGKTVTKKVNSPEKYTVKQRQRDGSVRDVERTRNITKTQKQVLHRDGADILQDLKKSRAKQTKLYKNNKFDDAIEQGKMSEKFENELERLAEFNKKDNILDNLKAAREDYAKAYSIDPYINDGKLNAVAFAKGNRKNMLTGEGKIIRDFAGLDNTKPSLITPKASQTEFSALENWALGAAAVADASTAGTIAGLSKAIPSMLLGKGSQQKFLNPNYGANGLLSTLGNPKTVRNSVTFPTLLSQSGIEDIEYLNRGLEPTEEEMQEIIIRGGGAR